MINKPHIYRRKIVATGKYYIGKHNGNNKYYKGSGVDYLEDYIKFVHNPDKDLEEEILEIVNNINQLNIREEYWLKKYDVANNSKYYNKTNRCRGWSHPINEQKQKISKSKIGIPQSLEAAKKKRKKMLGIPKHTKESKQLIGNKNSGPNIRKSQSLKGKSKTKTHCLNISKGKKGKTLPHLHKTIIQYDLDGRFIREYKNYEEIKLVIPHVNMHNVHACCKGRQKTSYGYKWKYKQ